MKTSVNIEFDLTDAPWAEVKLTIIVAPQVGGPYIPYYLKVCLPNQPVNEPLATH